MEAVEDLASGRCTAAAALQTAAAQHGVHIDARASTFMDLQPPVWRCPVQDFNGLRRGG